MKSSRVVAFAGMGLAAMASTVAQADIHISKGNIPGDTENILFQIDQATGLTQVGITNNTGFLVNFTGIETLDVSGSSGQARIEAEDGGLNSLCIELDNPEAGYRYLVLNLFSPVNTTGNVYFTVIEWDGTVNSGGQFTQTLNGNGQNFFTIWATNGQVIREVCFTTDYDLTDVRQVRMGGAHIVPGPAAIVPFAVGLMGALRRRRTR